MQTKNKDGSSEWTDPDDAPPLTAAMLEDAEVYQGETFVRRGPGRPVTGNAKELVSLRLDRDVLAKLREAGPGWQTQVNWTLRKALGLDQVVVAANVSVMVGVGSAGKSFALGGRSMGTTGAELGSPKGLTMMGINATIDMARMGWVSGVTTEEIGIKREAADRVEAVRPTLEGKKS